MMARTILVAVALSVLWGFAAANLTKQDEAREAKALLKAELAKHHIIKTYASVRP